MSKKDWQLLQAYQDTGLTPEEVERVKRERDAIEKEFREFASRWHAYDIGFPCMFCKYEHCGGCTNAEKAKSIDCCAVRYFEWRGVKEET